MTGVLIEDLAERDGYWCCEILYSNWPIHRMIRWYRYSTALALWYCN